ncbi:MAG: NAD-dependent protein deacylase [candidate division Zixibacteria bacterium HGW-Zixibacteria-1]|nr:MAG: NAD-dependent protein deacylase [candidate division Zixibacteria bacterium HGW-Zixibacteria-1]
MIALPSELLKALRSAKRVAVLTGAGISAESGVPTFRGKEGLWKKFRAEELATVEAFMDNPQLVWEWYMYRRELINQVKPNPGHYALVELENHFEDFTLITQNVDNLHQVAGSRNILELHGNIAQNKCLDCGRPFKGEIEITEAAVPRCECGGYLRPGVVWFGELLPAQAINNAIDASERAELFFSIGTSALVYPAASMPLTAKRNGAYLVEVNLEPTPLSDIADCALHGKSGEILPRIVERMKE